MSPDAQQAIAAYSAFVQAEHKAELNPKGSHSAELGAHAVDPALTSLEVTLASLAQAGVANRGTPPVPRVKSTRVESQAKPYPVVTLVDCPTMSPTWEPFYVATGKPAALAPAKVKPPYAITAKVIYYKGQWVVQETSADRSNTCSA